MQHNQYIWEDPLINFLITLDEQCDQSKEPYTEKNFYLLFDHLLANYSIENIVLISQIKNQIMDWATLNKTKTLNHLPPIIRKIFYLYRINKSELSLKSIFLNSLSQWTKDEESIYKAVTDRGSIITPNSKPSYYELKKLFQSTSTNIKSSSSEDSLDREPSNEKDYIYDFNRIRKPLSRYLNRHGCVVMSTVEPVLPLKSGVIYLQKINHDKIIMYSFGHEPKNLDEYEINALKAITELSFPEKGKDPIEITEDQEKILVKKIASIFGYASLRCIKTEYEPTFKNVVIHSVLFEAESDTSQAAGFTPLTNDMTDFVLLVKSGNYDVTAYHNGERYTNYIAKNKRFSYICTQICADAFQEILYDEINKEDILAEFNLEKFSFNKDFINRLNMLKNQHALYKDHNFFDKTYVFEAENRRFNISLETFPHNCDDVKSSNKVDIIATGKIIQNHIQEFKNTTETGVNTDSLTKDLIAINQAIAYPAKQNIINNLNQRAIAHLNSSEKRMTLGIMMFAFGVGLTILGCAMVAGTLGTGTVGGAALIVAGVACASTGVRFFRGGHKREKMGISIKKNMIASAVPGIRLMQK
jgi:hypothetical protein